MEFRVKVFGIIGIVFLIVPAYSYFILNNNSGTSLSLELSTKAFGEPRIKKHKFHLILPLVVSALLIKSIIFPLMVKAMAVMSSIAVMLSFMSLIVSSIIGYSKLAYSTAAPNFKVVYVDNKPKKTWTQPGEYNVPPIFRSLFSYVPHDEAFILGDDKPKIIDHYHSFVDK